MNDRNVLAPHIVHDNLADLRVHAAVPEKQQVAALERGLHTAGQHHDDGRGRVGRDAEPLPHHEGGTEDEREVEHLRGQLARLHGGEGGEHRDGFGSQIWEGGCGVAMSVLVMML